VSVRQHATLSIEVSLKRSSSADIQRNAMGATAHQFGVPQSERDYIKTMPLQKFDESRLIAIDHDQIGINAKRIHIDPVTSNAFGSIVGIISVGILHRRAVKDFPLL
jgi:hypothetical protein